MAPLSPNHKAVNSATPDFRFTCLFQGHLTPAPSKPAEAPPTLPPPPVPGGDKLTVDFQAVLAPLIPSLTCTFITRHHNFHISGKSLLFSSFLSRLAARWLDFTGLRHISKAGSLYQQKKVLLHLSIHFNLRPEAPDELFFPR